MFDAPASSDGDIESQIRKTCRTIYTWLQMLPACNGSPPGGIGGVKAKWLISGINT
jgi:hypothetical protein